MTEPPPEARSSRLRDGIGAGLQWPDAPGSAGTIDPLEARFRLDSVWAGACVTAVVCVPALVYALTDARPADRGLFISAWVFALAGAVAAFLVPWKRIIHSRWREPAFLTWTALDMLVIGVATIADGGPRSPVATLFLIPLVFVGVSYPRRSVLLVSVVTVSAYAAAAVAYSLPFGRYVLGLGAIVGVALMSVWQARNHDRRRAELARMSTTDPLTGCLNRRGAADAAVAALAGVTRFKQPVAMILIDLDNFKAYNDANGHVAGDELLCWLADQIRHELRPTDSLARLGGDEFEVLLAGVDAIDAAPTAARIRRAIADGAPHCTGIASAPADGTDIDALYRIADKALYSEKRRQHAHRISPGRFPPPRSP
ncbi:MAG: GGDEF domain-containing protein [Solirubrobacteraceae bacterium]